MRRVCILQRRNCVNRCPPTAQRSHPKKHQGGGVTPASNITREAPWSYVQGRAWQIPSDLAINCGLCKQSPLCILHVSIADCYNHAKNNLMVVVLASV